MGVQRPGKYSHFGACKICKPPIEPGDPQSTDDYDRLDQGDTWCHGAPPLLKAAARLLDVIGSYADRLRTQ